MTKKNQKSPPKKRKCCPKCGVEKPHTGFHKDSHRKDGLNSWCIICVRESRKNNYKKKREVGEAAYKNSRGSLNVRYKRCVRCGYGKLECEFNKNSHNKDGLQSWCRDCKKEHAIEYEKIQGKFNRIKKTYGITKEEYYNLIEAQGGLCPICNITLDGDSQIDVDHCHKTNKVRGILHTLCNKALGCLDDNPQRFRNAIAYLENNE